MQFCEFLKWDEKWKSNRKKKEDRERECNRGKM